MQVMIKCFLLPVIIFGFSLTTNAESSKTAYSVGYKVFSIPVSDHSILAAAWYPTESQTKNYHYDPSNKIKGDVAYQSPIKKGKWPVFILSHGFSGGALASVELTEAIAKRGWIVVAPDHSDAIRTVRINDDKKGNIFQVLEYIKEHPINDQNYAYRVNELKAVLKTVKTKLNSFIDENQIVLSGYSLGGWTSVKTILSEPAGIKAFVSYSMGEQNYLYLGKRYFSRYELRQLNIPTIYFYGSWEKEKNPRGAYAEFCFKNSNPPSYLVVVPGGTHFVYTSKQIAINLGANPKQLNVIIDNTLAFLEKHVLGHKADINFVKIK